MSRFPAPSHRRFQRVARLPCIVALAVAVAGAGLTACGTGPQARAEVRSVTVPVSQSRPLRVTVPQAAILSAPAGTFRGHGSISILVRQATLPYGGGLVAAGKGIDVRLSGVTLARPLSISFAVVGRPQPGDVPVVAHQLADGSWTLARAAFSGRRMTVSAQTFSLHEPAWLNPAAWMGWLGDHLASLIGGRTPPINCPGGGPAWASVVKHTDEAHACLIPNIDPASKAVRAEVQIKSNRGTALEVDIPPGAHYSWVQDQPWAARSWVWAHIIHQDPSVMALLPAGATMTAGYLQPSADEDLPFQVVVSYWSLAYSLIGDVVDVLTDLAAGATGMSTLYLMTKCSGAVDYGSLSVHMPLSTATFGSALKCVINQALSNLASPEKALGAARSLLGPGIDQVNLDAATKELTSVGGKLLTFGWVVALWPVLQLGWGGTADVVHSLLTGGRSTLISLHLRGAESGIAAVRGSWYVHDGSLCIGQSLVLPSSSSFPECSRSGNVGWTRWWLGCASYPSASVPVCNGWAELTFSPGPGNAVIGTVNKVFYTTDNNAVIPGYQQADSLAPGDTFELQKLAVGLLKTTYLHTHLSKLDLTEGNPYWCGPGISQADQFKCGA
jgi:hypothetical protein